MSLLLHNSQQSVEKSGSSSRVNVVLTVIAERCRPTVVLHSIVPPGVNPKQFNVNFLFKNRGRKNGKLAQVHRSLPNHSESGNMQITSSFKSAYQNIKRSLGEAVVGSDFARQDGTVDGIVLGASAGAVLGGAVGGGH